MNTNRRNVFVVVTAVAIATLACGPLGGGAPPKNTQIPSAPPATRAAASTPTPATGSEATATLSAAATTGGEATAGGGEATATPSSTYDTIAAQLTVPPLLTANAATAAAAKGTLRQWAAAAKGSSQYADTDYSASQAAGAPNSSADCGDNKTAWASSDPSGVDNLELVYTTTVVPAAVNIYEQNAPGSIVKVEVEEANGAAHTIYAGLPFPTKDCPRTFSIGVSGITAHVNRVKIYLDQSVIKSWDEIDAVELVGNP